MADRNLLGFLGATVLVGGGAFLGVPAAPRIAVQGAPLAAAAGAPHAGASHNEGSWDAAERFFAGGSHPKCAEPNYWSCIPAHTQPRFVIVTLPEPKLTHLALDFDRSIESLTAAAADEGFELQQFWLPWTTETEKDLSYLADRKLRKTDQEIVQSEPGLLIFRSSANAAGPPLFAFLVGETPTSGVNSRVLLKALSYERLIAGKTDATPGEIEIVGPSFSGSLAPLAKTLSDSTPRSQVRLISGMATNAEAIERMRATLSAFKNHSSFESVLEKDSVAQSYFDQYIDRRGWDSAIAVLSESGTTYGASNLASSPGWLWIRYPREIARLRNAFQEESQTLPLGKEQITIDHGVKLSLKEGTEQPPARDGISAFSPLQSPASQQAVLAAIGNRLRRDRKDLVGIVATDVLDSIFLSRYLRTSAPDARLFMLDADLLFLREVESAPLTGILAVTTYPLLLHKFEWAGATVSADRADRIQFASRYAEGVYDATRRALRAPTPGPRAPNPAREFPLWLTVLGRDGYWPVALLALPGSTDMAQAEKAFSPESPTSPWFVCFWLLVLVSFLHCLLLVLNRLNLSTGVLQVIRRKLRSMFTAYPERRTKPSERPYLLAITLAMAITMFVMTTTIRRLAQSGMVSLSFYVDSGSVIIVLLILVALFMLAKTSGKYLIIAAEVWALTIVFVAAWWMLLWNADAGSGYFFAYRSLGFTSGVSPAVPFLLLVVAIFCWGWAHLKREVQASKRSGTAPALAVIDTGEVDESAINPGPPSSGSPFLDSGLGNAAQVHFREIDESVREIFSPEVWVTATSFILLWVLIVMPWKSIRSFENRTYDIAYILLLGFLYSAMSASWGQFIWCWRRFHTFLKWLENQPVRDAFSRLDQGIRWVPLIGKPNEHLLFISGRCRDTLGALYLWGERTRPTGDLFDQLPAIYKEVAIQIAKVEEKAAVDEGYADEYRALQTAYTAATRLITADYEQRHLYARPPEVIGLEEDFLAFRYLMYMRYIFRHLRNMLGFVVSAFIISVVSLASYPFLAHRWIGFSSLIVCVALGIGVGIVFAQMDRDAILSRITKTNANELGSTFYWRMIQFGGLPVLTLLASLFPSINRYIFSWLQPTLASLR